MKDNIFDALKELLIASFDKNASPHLDSHDNFDNEDDTEALSLSFVNEPSQVNQRIFDEEEKAKLDMSCQSFLLFAEQLGLLTPQTREQVITKLMQIDADHINKDEAKWTLISHLDTNLSEEQLLFLNYALSQTEMTFH